MAKGARGSKSAPPSERPTRQSRRLHRDENGSASPLQQLPSPHRPARAKKNAPKKEAAISDNNANLSRTNSAEPVNAPIEPTQTNSETPLSSFTLKEAVSAVSQEDPSLKETHAQPNVLELGPSDPEDQRMPPPPVTDNREFQNSIHFSGHDEADEDGRGSESEGYDEVQVLEDNADANDVVEEVTDAESDVEILSIHSSQSDNDHPVRITIDSGSPTAVGTASEPLALSSNHIETPQRHSTQLEHELINDSDLNLYNYIRPRSPDIGRISETEAATSKDPPLSPLLSTSSFDSLFDELPMPLAVPVEIPCLVETPLSDALSLPYDTSVNPLPRAGLHSSGFDKCGELDVAVQQIDLNRHKRLILEIEKSSMEPEEPQKELQKTLRKNPNALDFFKDLAITGTSLNSMDNLLFGHGYSKICFDTKLKLLFADRVEIMSNREQLDVASALYSQGIGLTEANKRLRQHNQTTEEELKATKAALEAREAELETFRLKVKELEQATKNSIPNKTLDYEMISLTSKPPLNSSTPRNITETPQTTRTELSKKRTAPLDEDSEFLLNQRAAHRIRYEKRKSFGRIAEKARMLDDHLISDNPDNIEASDIIDIPKAYENAVNEQYKKVIKSRFMDRQNERRPYISQTSSTKKSSHTANPSNIGPLSPLATDMSTDHTTLTPSALVEAPQTPQQTEPVSSWRLGSLIGSVSKIPQYLFGRRTIENQPTPVAHTAPVQRPRNSIASQDDVDRIFGPPSTPTPGNRKIPISSEDLPDRILEQALFATRSSRPPSSDYKRFLSRRRPKLRYSHRRSIIDAEEERKEAATQAALAAREIAKQAKRDKEAEEMTHQPGDKRKRVKINDLKHIPNPIGCSYGLNPDFFDHGSDSEPDVEIDDDVSLLTPPPAKRVRFTDDTYSPGLKTDFVPPPPSPHSKIVDDPFHARPYSNKTFSTSSKLDTVTPAISNTFSTPPTRSSPYTGSMFAGPDSSEQYNGGNLFATSQTREDIDSPQNDFSLGKMDPNYNHAGSFEVPDDSDTESERTSVVGSPEKPMTASPSDSSRKFRSKIPSIEPKPTPNIFSSASTAASATTMISSSFSTTTPSTKSLAGSPIKSNIETSSKANSGTEAPTPSPLGLKSKATSSMSQNQNQSADPSDVDSFVSVLKKDQENSLKEKAQAAKDGAIASLKKQEEQRGSSSTPKAAESGDHFAVERPPKSQASPPNEAGAINKEQVWTQIPPPKPTPSHASLPSTQQASANPNDFDALARARSQAEKYKPKQPSGLRSSSRLPSSAIGSHNPGRDALPESPGYEDSIGQMGVPRNSEGPIASDSLVNGVLVNGEISNSSEYKSERNANMSRTEWDRIVLEGMAEVERQQREGAGCREDVNLSRSELDEVLKYVANVPEKLLIGRYTFGEALTLPCDAEVDAAVKKAVQGSHFPPLERKWTKILSASGRHESAH